jgi:hypothetical protein
VIGISAAIQNQNAKPILFSVEELKTVLLTFSAHRINPVTELDNASPDRHDFTANMTGILYIVYQIGFLHIFQKLDVF